MKLSRLAVLTEARGKGLAKGLCEEAAGWAARNKEAIEGGWEGLLLVHAQIGAEKVWVRLGFKTDERLGRWDEEGIEHLGMWRDMGYDGIKFG